MTYRSLLLHLDDAVPCAARTQVAIHLARDLGCHLVGVAPTGLVEVPVAAEAAAALGDYARIAWDTLRGRAIRAAERFGDECKAAGINSFEGLVDEADEVQSLVRHAHCSDLTVLTQADPKAPAHRIAQALVEKVVLYSARPTLILPYAGRVEALGSNALVAWDDSREAARAVSDALPLLRRARRVQVVSWNEPGEADDETLRPRLDALRQWLLWQGVEATMSTETTTIDVADALLSRAADQRCDLIVMGAYGHARWSERILGGATRGLLDAMTVPVLMSH